MVGIGLDDRIINEYTNITELTPVPVHTNTISNNMAKKQHKKLAVNMACVDAYAEHGINESSDAAAYEALPENVRRRCDKEPGLPKNLMLQLGRFVGKDKISRKVRVNQYLDLQDMFVDLDKFDVQEF